MRKIFFIISIIGISLKGYAQDELNTLNKRIPPKEEEINPRKPIEPPPKPIELKTYPPPVVKESDPFNEEELFKDPSLYKKESNSEGIYYRKNQYLGSFKTKAFTSTIRYRDAAFVDGDKTKIYLNYKVIEPEISLVGEFQEIKIKLVEGVNRIDFEALNEGSASPNTAEFQVYDDKGVVISSNQWNVGTGYKATVILVKE